MTNSETSKQLALPKLAVVILNYNGIELLKTFLYSVIQFTPKEYPIYVVDNCSKDESVEFVEQNFPTINVIANEKNLGFSAGYNEALKNIKSQNFVLLNNDVMVSEGWTIAPLTLLESNKEIAVVQPKIMSYEKPNFFEYAGAAGGLIDKYGYLFCYGRLSENVEYDIGQYDETKEIFWASGSAFFCRSEYWKLSEGFEESLFMHMEEFDLCWRFQNMGYKIMFTHKSKVFHLGGGTLNYNDKKKLYFNFRNNLLVLWKNLNQKERLIILVQRFCLDFCSLLLFLMRFDFQGAIAVHRAHRDFFKLKGKLSKKTRVRKKIKNLKGTCCKSIIYIHYLRKFRLSKGYTFKKCN